MVMKLSDVIELTSFASNVYRYLNPQEYVGKLAPSLGLILDSDLGISSTRVSVGREFVDVIDFLSMTYFRKPLVDALRTVNTGLQVTREAIPVISLTHAMGLGKTHFLTLLYHLYTKTPHEWSSIKANLPEEAELLLHKTNYRLNIGQKTLVIAIDLKHIPLEYTLYETLFVTMEHIIRKYKLEALSKQGIPRSSIDELLNTIKELGEVSPKDAARRLVKTIVDLGVTIPVLVIVDELYAAVFEAITEAIASGSRRYVDDVTNTILFLISFIDELRGKEPAIMVYASAMQDVNKWNKIKDEIEKIYRRRDKKVPSLIILKEVLDYFEERTRRVSPISVRDVSEEEALEIVKKRIIHFKHKIDLDKIIDFKELYSILYDVLKDEGRVAGFISELKKTYPFSPIYREIVRKLINPSYTSDFAIDKLQHLRDLIKISSTVIGRIFDSNDESFLVSIAHILHDDLKHLLDEGYAIEWGRVMSSWKHFINIVKPELNDENLIKMLNGALSSIYVKSVTNNASIVIDMLKNPLAPLREYGGTYIDRYALCRHGIVLSLVGLAPPKYIALTHRIFDELKRAPYIHGVDRDSETYYYASLFVNPYQLLKSIKEQELRKLRDREGRLNIEEAISYLGQKLVEYKLISTFKETLKREEKKLLPIEFISIKDLLDSKPNFINYLKKNEFTILIVQPIDLARETFLSKDLVKEDIKDQIVDVLNKYRNNIGTLNMFAIVVPHITIESLERLTTSLAEIKASEAVIDMLKSEDKRRRFVEQLKESHKTLADLMNIKSEEFFKKIVMDILETFRERLEVYAQQLNNVAVHDFTSEFINLFREVITYDPKTNRFTLGSIDIRVNDRERPKRIDKIFALLPLWIVTALKGGFRIADPNTINSELISWIKKLVLSKSIKRTLLSKQEYKYNINSIIEAFKRGWPEIPLKPQSIDAIEIAIKSLNGRTINIGDQAIKFVEVAVKDNYLIIKLKTIEILPPPPIPPTPPIRGFELCDANNIVIMLTSIYERSKYVENVNFISINIRVREDAKINIEGYIDKIYEFIEDVIEYINRCMNNITECKLKVLFKQPITYNELESMIDRIGISKSKVRVF